MTNKFSEKVKEKMEDAELTGEEKTLKNKFLEIVTDSYLEDLLKNIKKNSVYFKRGIFSTPTNPLYLSYLHVFHWMGPPYLYTGKYDEKLDYEKHPHICWILGKCKDILKNGEIQKATEEYGKNIKNELCFVGLHYEKIYKRSRKTPSIISKSSIEKFPNKIKGIIKELYNKNEAYAEVEFYLDNESKKLFQKRNNHSKWLNGYEWDSDHEKNYEKKDPLTQEKLEKIVLENLVNPLIEYESSK